MATIASLKRMSVAQLSERMLASPVPSKKLAIVDVRDDDYLGGHIKGSLHFPSSSFEAMLPTIVRKLQDAETVVFHCALSQQRGPGAALRYLRTIERSAKPAEADANGDPKPKQAVYVLEQGFSGWQEVHGEDERLTEGFRKELWRNSPWS